MCWCPETPLPPQAPTLHAVAGVFAACGCRCGGGCVHCCCGCMRCGCGRAANVIMAAGPMLRASLQLRLQLRAARRLLQASLRLRPSQPPPFTHAVQQPLLPLLLLLHSTLQAGKKCPRFLWPLDFDHLLVMRSQTIKDLFGNLFFSKFRFLN